MKRITILAAAGALVAAPSFGVWAASAATGADAPAVHVRHVADRRGEPEPRDDHGRHHRHHRRDDVVRVHTVGVHVEPGDDRGGRGEVEPGDDHGGRHDGGHHRGRH